MGRLWFLVLCGACARGAGAGGTPAFSIAYPDAVRATAKVGARFYAKPVAQCFYDNGREARWTTSGAHVADGELPPGLTIEDGMIGGVPTSAGMYRATIELTNVTCAGKPYPAQTVDVQIVVK